MFQNWDPDLERPGGSLALQCLSWWSGSHLLSHFLILPSLRAGSRGSDPQIWEETEEQQDMPTAYV